MSSQTFHSPDVKLTSMASGPNGNAPPGLPFENNAWAAHNAARRTFQDQPSKEAGVSAVSAFRVYLMVTEPELTQGEVETRVNDYTQTIVQEGLAIMAARTEFPVP